MRAAPEGCPHCCAHSRCHHHSAGQDPIPLLMRWKRGVWGATTGARTPLSSPQVTEDLWLLLLKPYHLSWDQKAQTLLLLLPLTLSEKTGPKSFTLLSPSCHPAVPAVGRQQQELKWQGNQDNAVCKPSSWHYRREQERAEQREVGQMLGNPQCRDVRVLTNRCAWCTCARVQV